MSIVNKYFSLHYFLSYLLIITVIGLSFPYGFPLFSLSIFIYLFIAFINKQIQLKINWYIILMFVCIIIYLISMLFNGGFIYDNNVSDIIGITNIIILLFLIGNLDRDVYKKFLSNFLLLISIIMPIVALFSLYKYTKLLAGVRLDFLMGPDSIYPWGTSLMPDYNMFSLGLIIGLIGTISLFNTTNSFFYKIYCISGSIIISTSVLLSGSRRGLLILIVFLFVLLLYSIIKIVRLRKLTFKGSISVIISLIFSMFFVKIFDITIINEYEYSRLIDRYQTIGNFDDGFSSRTSLWQFSYELIGEGNILTMLFGNGFNYLESLSNKVGVVGEVYPHNPIISAVLYSGIIGSFLIILLLFIPLIKIIRFWNIYKFEMLGIYIVTITFLIISQNSVFSANILWLLMLIIGGFNSKIYKYIQY